MIFKILFLLISSFLFANEQIAFKVSNRGFQKILESALQYNNPKKDGILIPSSMFHEELSTKEIKQNPFYSLLTQISDISLNDRIKYSLSHGPIKVRGDLDTDNVKIEVIKSSDWMQEIEFSVSFKRLSLDLDDFMFCENYTNIKADCRPQQSYRISGVNLDIQSPIEVKIRLKLETSQMVTRISVTKTTTNLNLLDTRKIKFDLGLIQLPQVSLVINGQKVTLSQESLQKSILSRKKEVLSKLIAYSSDFMANDLVEMLNKYLIHKKVLSQWQYHYLMYGISLNEFIASPQYKILDGSSEIVLPVFGRTLEQEIAYQFSHVIKNAQVGLKFQRVSSPENKSLEIFSQLFFMVNDKKMSYVDKSSNLNKKITFKNTKKSDFSLSLSASAINGALGLVNNSGFIQNAFYGITKMNGIYIESVNIHFFNSQKMSLIVNLKIDLKKLDSKNFIEKLKNKIGVYLERNNNDSVLYFPLEISVSFYPVKKDNVLSFYVHSPFGEERMVNHFNYPSNINQASSLVFSGLKSELKKSLEGIINKRFDFNVDSYLSSQGVKLKASEIKITDKETIELGINLESINFKALAK